MLPVIFKIIQYLHVTYKIIKNYTHSICHIQIHLKSITHTLNLNVYLVLTIFNEGTFHKALNLFKFDCEITLETVPETNQYIAIRVKFLAQGNNEGL